MISRKRAGAAVRTARSRETKGRLLSFLGKLSDSELAKWNLEDSDEDETILAFILEEYMLDRAQDAVAGLGPQSTAASGSSVSLTTFFRALQDATLLDVGNGASLLSLSPGESFPEGRMQFRSTMLVRDFYANLLERMKQGPAWLLTGVPGTGKSWWIWYAMYRLLQEPEPPTIVWQTFKRSGRRVRFKDGVAHEGSSDAFSEDLAKAATWFFVDGMLPEWVSARTIMVCSPKRSIYNDWVKGCSGIQLTMPLWSWPEIEKCWDHMYQNMLPLERVKRNFDLWYGGVPRLVLEDPASRNDDSRDEKLAMAAINTTSLEQVCRAIGGEYDSGSGASHRVIHQDSDRSTFSETVYGFATSTVAARFFEEVSDNSVKAQVLAGLAGPSNILASSRGQLFEAAAHRILSSGGCFEYKFLDVPGDHPVRNERGRPSGEYTAARQAALEAATVAAAVGITLGQPLRLQLPICGQPVIFTTGSGVDIGDFRTAMAGCQGPSYLQPSGPAHPVIDACIYPDTVVQCTVTSGRKALNEDVLEQHLLCLPERQVYYLDYVVPSDVYEKFKAPDLKRETERVRKTLVRVVKINCALRPATRSVRQLSTAPLQRVPRVLARHML